MMMMADIYCPFIKCCMYTNAFLCIFLRQEPRSHPDPSTEGRRRASLCLVGRSLYVYSFKSGHIP